MKNDWYVLEIKNISMIISTASWTFDKIDMLWKNVDLSFILDDRFKCNFFAEFYCNIFNESTNFSVDSRVELRSGESTASKGTAESLREIKR